MKIMTRAVVCGLAALLTIGILSGCKSKTKAEGTKLRSYVGKKGDYTLQIPKRWKIIDDDRKLTEARDQANARLQGPLRFEFNPDAIFGENGNDKLMGMVVVSPTPLPASDGGKAAVGDRNILDIISNTGAILGIKPEKQETRDINGKTFRIETAPTADGALSLAATCLHGGEIYMFQLVCERDRFEEWRPVFERVINSISFVKADIDSVQSKQKNDRAGFFTGLWHGIIAPFRLLASIVCDVDIYSHNNSGKDYLTGFILGVIFLLGGGASSRGRA